MKREQSLPVDQIKCLAQNSMNVTGIDRYLEKPRENSNKDDDVSPTVNNDKSISQKFRWKSISIYKCWWIIIFLEISDVHSSKKSIHFICCMVVRIILLINHSLTLPEKILTWSIVNFGMFICKNKKKEKDCFRPFNLFYIFFFHPILVSRATRSRAIQSKR